MENSLAVKKRNDYFIISIKSFLLIFLIILFFQFYINQTEFYYDGKFYYQLSKTFFGEQNQFSFLNYPRTYRGYFFPLLLSPVRGIFIIFNGLINEFHIYRVYVSLLLGITFGLLIPESYEKIFHVRINLLKRVVLILLVIYFWGGLLIHPLSDMYMVATLACVIYFFSKMITEINAWKLISFGFFAGFFLYGSYNIRSINIIYIYSFVLIFFLYFKKRKIVFIFLGLISISGGMLLSSYPEMIINNNVYHKVSPFILAEDVHTNLFVNQLYRGINTERFQNYVGEEDIPPGMVFSNDVGSKIFDSVRGEINFKSYIILVSQYPLDFIQIYIKHFFTAMDIRWRMNYVYDLIKTNNLFAWLNFSVWFVVLFFSKQIFPQIKSIISPKYLFFLFLLPPSIFSIPAPTESRYYISMFVFIYIFISYSADWKEIIEKIHDSKMLYLKYYLSFILVLFSISGWTFGNYEFFPIFLSNNTKLPIYIEILIDKIF